MKQNDSIKNKCIKTIIVQINFCGKKSVPDKFHKGSGASTPLWGWGGGAKDKNWGQSARI